MISVFLFAVNVDGQSAKEEIKSLLLEQADFWNKGDIEGFMQGYIPTEDLHFLGKNGLTSGWQATLDRYKKTYPDKQTMGQLTFDFKEITERTKKIYTVIGHYHLARTGMEDAEGYFLIVLQKIKGDWKIVADSSH